MIDKFLKEEQINGLKESSLKVHGSILRTIQPKDTWSKDDINNCISSLQAAGRKPATIEMSKIVLRKYFRWLNKPEIVAHLKARMPKGNLKRSDILDVADIDKLIEATPSTLYKALIALLFESGARINEVLAVKVKDIQESDKGMIISIPATKTGQDYRRVLCPFSAQYIRNHISYTALDKDDLIFNVCVQSVWEMLKKIGKKAGIEKPISAHKFRHAQATDMVIRGYQESIIKKKLGWVGDSKMIDRYAHVVDSDVINATAAMTGQEIERKPIINMKQAESLKIADASLQLSKLNEENQDLKARMEKMEKLLNRMFSDDKVMLNELQGVLPEETMKENIEFARKVEKRLENV